MALLTIDVGNTNTVLGVYEDGRLQRHWRVATDHDRTVDEHVVLMHELMTAHASTALSAAAMSCVVPALTDTYVTLCRRAFGLDLLVVGPGVRTGMPIAYENPRGLGSDRVVNAIAAYERARGAAIVVDFGTATKIEYVAPEGTYVGGVICPGIGISAAALYAAAAKLYEVELLRPERVIGRNTVHAIQSGLVLGHVTMVDGLVRRIERENGVRARVIATGGLSALLADDSETIQEVDEFLTLDGLRLVHERNAAHGGGAAAWPI